MNCPDFRTAVRWIINDGKLAGEIHDVDVIFNDDRQFCCFNMKCTAIKGNGTIPAGAGGELILATGRRVAASLSDIVIDMNGMSVYGSGNYMD